MNIIMYRLKYLPGQPPSTSLVSGAAHDERLEASGYSSMESLAQSSASIARALCHPDVGSVRAGSHGQPALATGSLGFSVAVVSGALPSAARMQLAGHQSLVLRGAERLVILIAFPASCLTIASIVVVATSFSLPSPAAASV